MYQIPKKLVKAVLILAVAFVAIYGSGRLFSLASVFGGLDYFTVPILYSIFLVLPVLLIIYSESKTLKIVASIVLVLFLLSSFVPIILNFQSYYHNTFVKIGNPVATVLSMLYVAPFAGGLITLMTLFNAKM